MANEILFVAFAVIVAWHVLTKTSRDRASVEIERTFVIAGYHRHARYYRLACNAMEFFIVGIAVAAVGLGATMVAGWAAR